MRPTVWSYGGGVQSVAIAVLVIQGKLPRPDVVVIADTGRETQATWDYLDQHIRPLLAPLEVHVVSHEAARVDLYSSSGKLLIPAYAKTPSGREARLPTYCSSEWKRDPISRWLRSRGYGPKAPVRIWLGISTDELGRVKPSRVKWMEHHYPLLLDVPTSRADSLLLVEKAGLPRPPRSACWMCPHHSDQEWRIIRDERPDEWAKAQAFEQQIQEREGRFYLHRSMVPLDEVELDEAPGLWDQDGCSTGYCFT